MFGFAVHSPLLFSHTPQSLRWSRRHRQGGHERRACTLFVGVAGVTHECSLQIDDITFVLEQEQLDMGFALLCMSRPVPGEAVTIEAQCDWGNISMSNWKGATFFSGEPVPLWKDDVKGLRG